MVPSAPGSRLAPAIDLSRVAPLYWLGIFPLICCERRRWTRRAKQIPDPLLRGLALSTIEQEWGNVEGASAFGTLVRGKHRGDVVRALSAFQVIYDYVDTLVEQRAADPVRNGLRLHLALRVALDPTAAHPDYYAYHPRGCDGGYLRELVERCRANFSKLPSRSAVREPTLQAICRMETFQALNHSHHAGWRKLLARWASRQTASRCGLRWWETAAATASSLTVFALIAAGSQTALQSSAAWRIQRAYYPWIAALHVLLDSLLDHEGDLAAGRHSLIQHYRSPQEAAQRIAVIAAEATRHTQALPDGRRHRMILAAMTSFYLSAAPSRSPYTQSVRPLVLAAMGELARPTMLIMGARRQAARLKSCS